MAASTALRELGADLRGELICRQDSAYDEVRTVFNGMIDRRPLAVVRCAGAPDAGFPSGQLHYWKSGSLRHMTDEAIEDSVYVNNLGDEARVASKR